MCGTMHIVFTLIIQTRIAIDGVNVLCTKKTGTIPIIANNDEEMD